MHCSNLIKFAAAFDREIERYLRVLLTYLRIDAVPLCVCVLTSRHVEVGLMDGNRTCRLPVRFEDSRKLSNVGKLQRFESLLFH